MGAGLAIAMSGGALLVGGGALLWLYNTSKHKRLEQDRFQDRSRLQELETQIRDLQKDMAQRNTKIEDMVTQNNTMMLQSRETAETLQILARRGKNPTKRTNVN